MRIEVGSEQFGTSHADSAPRVLPRHEERHVLGRRDLAVALYAGLGTADWAFADDLAANGWSQVQDVEIHLTRIAVTAGNSGMIG